MTQPPDFWVEISQVTGERDNIFKVLKEKKLPTKNTISGKTVLQNRKRNKYFPRFKKDEEVYYH